jgi:alcohol dehydrogenase
LPAVAILDAELTLTQPREVTAASGLDALSHAVESFVTRRRNELSLMFSREAFRLVSESLPVVLRQPGNLDARAAVQLGAALAGVAVENSMLGAAHSAANPLTARFGLTHGVAVAVMLPHVVRFNGAELYRPLHENLPALLEELLAIAGIAPRLRDHGVTNAPALAGEAARQWTAQFNPRPPDFVAIYEAAQ